MDGPVRRAERVGISGVTGGRQLREDDDVGRRGAGVQGRPQAGRFVVALELPAGGAVPDPDPALLVEGARVRAGRPLPLQAQQRVSRPRRRPGAAPRRSPGASRGTRW
ncbi:hypothetical protein GCM10020221_01230 [Streptomyces thioluteus]|uniref:Uncharacterized protein n=1 Tax=Streptomyces thioluteus TaxID=66431 RepID=A0ABP6ITJ3_STRTU